jgi:cytochrome c oxidase assembly protein subunit 15
MPTSSTSGRLGAGDLLAISLGTSVTMWLIGYVSRVLPGVVPSWVVAALLLGSAVAGGFLAGRYTDRGAAGGAMAGLITSLVNLMVLGSLVGGSRPNELLPSAIWWLPGSLVAGAGLGLLGAAIAVSRARPARKPINWTGAFAAVAAAATFLLIVAGGLVTSHQAGLAVVDWPNSYGYNIFLYPLARMTGGIYYEHAHRLAGSLVGLTTLVLALHLQRVDRRAWVRNLGWIALGAVIVQGVLGGLRVTGRFTLATTPDAVAPSIALAVVHGAFAQLFFSLVVALAAFASTTWLVAPPARADSRAAVDHAFTTLLVPVLVVQLVLGALQRHLSQLLMAHIAFAMVVVILAITAAVRARSLYPDLPVLPRLGRALIALVSVQVTLGVLAFAVVSTRAAGAEPTAYEVIARTAHQANGALLLAATVLLLVWNRRLLRPAE